jgi:mannose-6-phosphate isomerase-like protein (cupin superfamily)
MIDPALIIPCNQVPFEQNGVLITRLTLGGHYEFTQTACAIPEHTHTADTAHDTLILKGSFKLTLGGVIRLVQAGDIIDLPPGVPHAFMALEDGATLVNVNQQRSRMDTACPDDSRTPPPL